MAQFASTPSAVGSPDVLKVLSILLVALNPGSGRVKRANSDSAEFRASLPTLRGGSSVECGSVSKTESDGSSVSTDHSLAWCENARILVLNNSIMEMNALRQQMQASSLNPRNDFAESVDQIYKEGMRAYEQSAKACEKSLAYKCKREALERALTAGLLRLTRLQLSHVRDDALCNFRVELVMLMSESTNYKKASDRLIRKIEAKYSKAARANIPTVLERYRDALLHSKVSSLRSAMVAEADTHEVEATELPPRAQDVGPAPWYKQVLVQILGMALNVGQAYFLQHLPAKFRDRRDEREMPRGPLF